MAQKKTIREKILAANENLLERAKKEKWILEYEPQFDILYLGPYEVPSNSHYVGIGEEGFLIRIKNKTFKIVGFSIENFDGYFSKHHPEFRNILGRKTKKSKIKKQFSRKDEIIPSYATSTVYFNSTKIIPCFA